MEWCTKETKPDGNRAMQVVRREFQFAYRDHRMAEDKNRFSHSLSEINFKKMKER